VGGRNPAPADRLFIPLFVGFQPSKVVQDFFHPQYVSLPEGITMGCPWGIPKSQLVYFMENSIYKSMI